MFWAACILDLYWREYVYVCVCVSSSLTAGRQVPDLATPDALRLTLYCDTARFQTLWHWVHMSCRFCFVLFLEFLALIPRLCGTTYWFLARRHLLYSWHSDTGLFIMVSDNGNGLTIHIFVPCTWHCVDAPWHIDNIYFNWHHLVIDWLDICYSITLDSCSYLILDPIHYSYILVSRDWLWRERWTGRNYKSTFKQREGEGGHCSSSSGSLYCARVKKDVWNLVIILGILMVWPHVTWYHLTFGQSL